MILILVLPLLFKLQIPNYFNQCKSVQSVSTCGNDWPLVDTRPGWARPFCLKNQLFALKINIQIVGMTIALGISSPMTAPTMFQTDIVPRQEKQHY